MTTNFNRRLLIKIFGPIVLIAVAQPTWAQSPYTLTITAPRPVGASPDLLSTHRVFWAHVDVQYRIPVLVKGGVYPYTCTLSGQPAWLSISQETQTNGANANQTWVIKGTPTNTTTDDDASITVQCTDAASNSTSQTWGIDVVNGAPFLFLDAAAGNDSTGSGTKAAPWQTLGKLCATTNANTLLYLRAGTYTLATCAENNSGLQNATVTWDSGSKPTAWMAYPGDTQPVIDFRYAGSTFFPRIDSASVWWVDGLRFTRHHNNAFGIAQIVGRGNIFWNNLFDNFGPPTGSGTNAGVIFLNANTGDTVWARGSAIIGNRFTALSDGSATKTYRQQDLLIADNTVDTGTYAAVDIDAAFAIKGDHENVEIRNNKCTGWPEVCLGGNQQTADRFEARFNYFYRASDSGPKSGYAVYLNQSSVPGELAVTYDIGRNTIRGRIAVDARTGSGPYVFSRNVLINTDGSATVPFISMVNNTDSSLFTMTNNLTGIEANGITDSSGALQGSFLTDHGPNSATPKGYQVEAGGGGGSPSTGTTPTMGRTGIRVREEK